MLLVALTLPGVRVVRVGGNCPYTPDGHAVVVDVDIPLGCATYNYALPRVSRSAKQICKMVWSILHLASLSQVPLIQLTGVAGSICGRSCKQTSENHCTCDGGRGLLFKTHLESPLLLETLEEFL